MDKPALCGKIAYTQSYVNRTWIHVLMRDDKEERKKQARLNKQTNKQGKATQHACVDM